MVILIIIIIKRYSFLAHLLEKCFCKSFQKCESETLPVYSTFRSKCMYLDYCKDTVVHLLSNNTNRSTPNCFSAVSCWVVLQLLLQARLPLL